MIDELKQWEYDRGYEKGKTDMLDVLDKIRDEIEKAMDDFYYDEHDLGVRAGFRFALEIIDNHISGKEQE